MPQSTNDHSKVSQFADDTASWANGKKPKKVLQTLQKLNNRLVVWCKTWRIKLSPNKTQYIIFHRKHVRKRNLIMTIDGCDLRPANVVEFLGVKLDSSMTFKKHQKKINTELKRRKGRLSQITGSHYKPKASTELSMKIFRSMILPVVTYAPAATCIREDACFKKQDHLLRQAAKLALHAPPSARDSYIDREAKLPQSKPLTMLLAKNYLLSETRSDPVKQKLHPPCCQNIADRS